MSDPALLLGYAFEEPATVLVTVDPAHPVENTLTLVITNRSGAAVEFPNPEGLTPSAQLPAWNDAGSPLGRLSVWFPWGDATGDLATVGDSQSIVASSLVPDWAASDRMSDPTIGVYWTLFPLSKGVFLGQDESISFQFSQIVSHAGTGGTVPEQSWMTGAPRVPGYTAQQAQLAVWKDELSATLTGPATAPPGESITLTWKTAGVDSCELDPGDLRGLAPNGQQELSMPAEPSTTWTLTAYPHVGGSPIYARATVTAQTGWTDLGPVTSGLPGDGALLARLGDQFLVFGPAADCWTSPDASAWRKVAQLSGVMADTGLAAGPGRAWQVVVDMNTGYRRMLSSTDGESWTALGDGLAWSFADGYELTWALGSLWAFPDSTVWSSQDGVNWSQHPAPPWSSTMFPPIPVEFAGRLWTFFGYLGTPKCQFYSSADGSSWSQGRATPWDDQHWMVGAAATRSHAYVATRPQPDGPNSLWQMDAGQNWTPVALPQEVAGAAENDMLLSAADELLFVYVSNAGHVWTYAPPLAGAKA